MNKPKVNPNSLAAQEMEKIEKQFDKFDSEVKEMTLDRLNATPKVETEEQTKIAQKDIRKMNDVYLKPLRSIASREKFNERFREKLNFDKEYVHFIAENKEIIGETLEFWTKPYPGMPAEFWNVPANKPVHAPRYVAEQIKRKFYHRLTMDQTVTTGADGMGQYYGQVAVDTTIQRLDARPVSTKQSVFMSSGV